MDIETLYKVFYRPLCLYAMHYLSGDRAQAEDIVQECYVKMWQTAADNPRAFLYTAVRNSCIDHLRRAKVPQSDIGPHDLEGIISDEEAQDRSVTEARLWSAIDHLPDRCRRVFLMGKRDGMKYKEIAAELGVTEKVVEHEMSKALKQLRGSRREIFYVVSLMA
jgi:RNA polymerase sigma-70 factor (family 1)